MVPSSCSDWVQAVQECRVQRVEVSVCTLQTHTLKWVVSVAQLDKAQHCHAQNGRTGQTERLDTGFVCSVHARKDSWAHDKEEAPAISNLSHK